MNQKNAIVSGVVSTAFLLMLLVPMFGTIRAVLLSWGIIITGFALLAGIIELIKTRVIAIIHREQPLHSSIIILSFLGTFLVGMCNPARDYFEGSRLMSENNRFVRGAVSATIEDHKYFSGFPAKAKLFLVLCKMVTPRFIPTDQELHNAGFTRSEFRRLFTNRERVVHEPALSRIFIPGDIQRLRDLLPRIRALGPAVYKDLHGDMSRIVQWYKENRLSFITAASSETTDIPPLRLENRVVPDAGKSVVRTVAEHLNNSAVYTEKEQLALLYRDRTNILISAGLHKHLAENLTGTAARISDNAGYQITASFMRRFSEHTTPFAGGLRWVFRTVYRPLSAGILSLLLFFSLFAVFRTFRFSSRESGVMIASAIAVLAGQIPLSGHSIFTRWLSDISVWLREVPTAAAYRALLISAGLGICLLSAKVLTGVLLKQKNGERK